MNDDTIHTTVWTWSEYNDYVANPENNQNISNLESKIELEIKARPPFLISYTDIASAPPPSNNEEKEATVFFVNILLIVPLVYYILKEELKSTTERDENDTKLIKYIVKFGFQDYLPSIITNSHVKEAYNLQVSLLQEGTVHVAATIFITYMIVSAMSHDGGQKVLDQALRHLVDQEVDQDHESTITNLGEIFNIFGNICSIYISS